jgi:hypothetical protein
VNSFGLCVCEVCGTLSADHAGWFAVAGVGSHMEILPWSDELRARPDCRHACCPEHVQQLVFSTAARDFARPKLPLSPYRGGWNPLSLVPLGDSDVASNPEDSLRNVLDAIDSILQGPTADEEEQPSFDA